MTKTLALEYANRGIRVNAMFTDVWGFEAFKYLHLGMISDVPRKSLPAIARAVGLPNCLFLLAQALGRTL